jgi:hypothetical protein
MKSIEVEVLDQVEEQFLTDGDLNEILSAYARGTISKSEMSDRLEFTLAIAQQRADALVNGPREVDMDGLALSREDQESA